jgi:hypothetical protein
MRTLGERIAAGQEMRYAEAHTTLVVSDDVKDVWLMIPLFDKDAVQVGWASDDFGDIFNFEMDWVGFTFGGDAWRVSDVAWVGPIIERNIYDRSGAPIVWSNDNVASQLPVTTPDKPFKPTEPVKHMKLLRQEFVRVLPAPDRGWSEIAFDKAFG